MPRVRRWPTRWQIGGVRGVNRDAATTTSSRPAGIGRRRNSSGSHRSAVWRVSAGASRRSNAELGSSPASTASTFGRGHPAATAREEADLTRRHRRGRAAAQGVPRRAAPHARRQIWGKGALVQYRPPHRRWAHGHAAYRARRSSAHRSLYVAGPLWLGRPADERVSLATSDRQLIVAFGSVSMYHWPSKPASHAATDPVT